MKISIKNIMTLSPLKISIVLVILALVVFFMDPHFLRFMELKALDLRMVSRGQLPTTGQVIIATVDEKSLSEIGRWPWSRSMTAKLVDSLKEYGAKAVGFDIVFAEPEQSACPSADAILAKSVKSAKNVSLGYFFHTSMKDVEFLTEEYINASGSLIGGSMYSMVREKGHEGDYNLITAYAPVPSIKAIAESGENCGYFNAFPDPDGVIRWSPLVIKFQDNFYYS